MDIALSWKLKKLHFKGSNLGSVSLWDGYPDHREGNRPILWEGNQIHPPSTHCTKIWNNLEENFFLLYQTLEQKTGNLLCTNHFPWTLRQNM